MTDRTGQHEHPVTLDQTEARQGRSGMPMLYVTMIGTLLAFVVLGLLYLFFW